MSLRKNPIESPRHKKAAATAENPDGPMTPEQINYLRQLWRRAGDADAFDETLTCGEAQKRITALEIRLQREQHSGRERLPRT